jgi:hypothetical protein
MSLLGIIASQNYPRQIVSTKFLLAGGNAGVNYKKTFLYDIAADTYTAKTDMTQDAAEYPGGGYYNGDAFVFGGGYSNNYKYNYAYSVSGNTWSAKTDMTAGRLELTYTTYQNKFYAFGGKAVGSNNTRVEVYYYDPVANTWSQVADMPNNKGSANAGVIGSKIYVNGGYRLPPSPEAGTLLTYEYDVTANTWATVADSTYIHARNPGTNASDGTYLYCFGSTAFSANNEAERYDPVSNTWSNLTDSTNTLADNYAPYFYAGDGKFYTGSGNGQSATQVYTISSNGWTGKSGTPATGMTRAALVGIP